MHVRLRTLNIMFLKSVGFCFLVAFVLGLDKDYSKYRFPKDFLFGVSTSAYQIEGAWNESGKGPSNLDDIFQNNKNVTIDGSNGNVACNSYHLYKEDIKLVKNLGVHFYRFSISWSRILPNGINTTINEDGIRYYNNLIDDLIANHIQPMVTLVHFDLPLNFHVEDKNFIEYFLGYVRIAFKNFGDRVKYWFTFNEPYFLCADDFTPNYDCGHNLLKAHAAAYHLYKKEFKPKQRGQVTIVLNTPWYEPASKDEKDIQAAERVLQFYLGWFANPIFGKLGDYPPVLKEFIGERSIVKKLNKSELPTFTKAEIDYIKGSADFFAINHYTSHLTQHHENASTIDTPETITQARWWQDPKWTASPIVPDLRITPWGFRKLLMWIHRRYYGPKIYVTENGWADDGSIYDLDRIKYIVSYLSEMLDAMQYDKVRVKAYSYWALIDNFEWIYGYTAKFGLYHVDFNNSSRPRLEKNSVKIYKNIIANRNLTGKFCD